MIQSDLLHSYSIEGELKRFFGLSTPISMFSKEPVPFVLLKAYSSTFYGCQLWCSNKSDLNRISVGWNNAVRRICGVPRKSHVGIMMHATGLLI